MSLPLLPLPLKSSDERGKRSRSLDRPCIPELRYEDGETINLDQDTRIIGRSSLFMKKVHDRLPPFGPDDVATLEQLRKVAAAYDTPNSWDTVLRELYSIKNGPLKHDPGSLEEDDETSYKTRYDNALNPQYYLFVTQGPSTVSHLMLRGFFFDDFDGEDKIEVSDPRVGKTVYTKGFVWTNADPRWAWKETRKKKRVIRCVIKIPAGTQVVFDRSPVMAADCEMENGKLSLYPDVLLPAGKFQITGITTYMTTSGRTDTPGGKEKPDQGGGNVVYLEKRSSYVEPTVNDFEYAGNRLIDADEFVDIKLTLERSVVFPSKGSFIY